MMEKNASLYSNITDVRYQTIDHINSVSPGESEFTRVVNFKSGYDWEKLYRSPGSASLREEHKVTGSGHYFDQKLSLNFPGFSQTNLEDFHYLDNRPLVLKLTFSDGTVKVMGSLDQPARINTIFQSSSTTRGTRIDFTCESSFRCMIHEEEGGGPGGS